MTRPTCHIILTHLLDPLSLPASELSALTPSLSGRPPRRDSQKVTSRLDLCQREERLGPPLPSLFRCSTPDARKKCDSCIAALFPPTASTWSQAVITQLHAPRPRAADWSLSDGWQGKLSEGIKYSHTAVRRSRGKV